MKRQGMSGMMVLIILGAMGGGYYFMTQENGGDINLPSELENIVNAGGGGGAACGAVESYVLALNNSNIGNAQNQLLIPEDLSGFTGYKGAVGNFSCQTNEMSDSRVNDTIERLQGQVDGEISDAASVDATIELCGSSYAEEGECVVERDDHVVVKTEDGWKLEEAWIRRAG